MCVSDFPGVFARDFVLKFVLKRNRLVLQVGQRIKQSPIRVRIIVAIAFPVREMRSIFITQCSLQRFNGIDHVALQPCLSLCQRLVKWSQTETVGGGFNPLANFEAFVAQLVPKGCKNLVVFKPKNYPDLFATLGSKSSIVIFVNSFAHNSSASRFSLKYV